MELEGSIEDVQKVEVSTSNKDTETTLDDSKSEDKSEIKENPKEDILKTTITIQHQETLDKTEETLNVCKTSSPEDDSNILQRSFETHPYKQLLLNFHPTTEQMSRVEKIDFSKTLKQTPLCDVITKDHLEELVADLKNQKEVGFDVEYSDHGYKALTCLIQISTNDKDYIIDAIALKNEMDALKEVLTDPNIVKIFHSSGNDLKWLQQDFGLFVINMFDTQKAMKALGYKRLGLDALLQDFNIHKDKSMQREDFRKRPLPPKFKDYARTDSHYLIAFYHKLKNELIEANLLREVFKNCNDACKVVYDVVEDPAYSSVVNNIKEKHRRQLLVLEKLNRWRHKTAEYLDKNVGCILSKNNMEALVEKMPNDRKDILTIAHSEHVKEHLDEITGIMSEGVLVKRGNRFFQNKRKFRQTDFGKQEGDYFGGNNPKGFDLRNRLRVPVNVQSRKRRRY